MADCAAGYVELVQKIKGRAADPVRINLNSQHVDDAKFAELADWLVLHPDVVTEVWISNNALTDESGVKLAQMVAKSSVIRKLGMNRNRFGEATYLAMAKALRVNTSLDQLALHGNLPVDVKRVEAAFGEALRANPDRPEDSWWSLHDLDSQVDFDQLKTCTDD